MVLKGLFLCYDADMSMNPQVYEQCKLLVEEEIGDYFPESNIYMVTWDQSLGKGIDDLIENGHKSSVRKILFSDYVSLFDEFLSGYERNSKGEYIDPVTKELIEKDRLHKDYMENVFPKIEKLK